MKDINFKTGPGSVALQPYDKIYLQAEMQAMVKSHTANVDEETGEIQLDLLFDVNTIEGMDGLRLKAKDKPIYLEVVIPKTKHWWYDIFTMEDAKEPYDPIPNELPDDARFPEPLDQKLARMVGVMAQQMFGRQSQEMETLEDMLDFDLDGDGEIGDGDFLSGYEIEEMEDVGPINPPVEEQPSENTADSSAEIDTTEPVEGAEPET